MAGKKHHYIPKFFLKGFCHKTTPKSSYFWVYPKSGPAFESNIENFFAEKFFYGSSEDSELDNIMTDDHEFELSKLVASLRAGDELNLKNNCEISKLVHHLAIRTKNIRQYMNSKFEQSVQKLKDVVNDKDSYENLIRQMFFEEPYLENLVSKDIEKIQPNISSTQKHLLLKRVKEKGFSEFKNNPSQLQEIGSSLIEMFDSRLSVNKGKYHNIALKEYLTDDEFSHQILNLHWKIINYPKHSLILGDSVSFGVDGTDGKIKHVLLCDKLENVVMPLTHSKALIGGKSDIDRSLFSSHFINTQSANISMKCFASSRNNSLNKELATKIGSGL